MNVDPSTVERQLRSNFNDKRGSGLNRVTVVSGGQVVGEWERDSGGTVRRIFPKPEYAMSTGRRGSGLVSWSLKLSPPGGTVSVAGAVRLVLSQLGGFGEARSLRLVTAEDGDCAPPLELTGEVEQLERLLATPGLEEVWLGLDLHLYLWTGLSDTDLVPDGASLWVETGPEGELLCTLFLHVDFHSPRTWVDDRDNRTLHRWNGPQLEAFIKRLERSCGAQVESMDAGDYAGLVHPRGFHAAPPS